MANSELKAKTRILKATTKTFSQSMLLKDKAVEDKDKD